MTEAVGWQLPDVVESLQQDYNVLRCHAGLADLGPLSLFELVGQDATVFLQGMISNDVKVLRPGEGCIAVILTPIGKMIADLIVLKFSEERFWILCRRELKGKTMDSLNRFIVSDQVELNDISNHSVVGVVGPLSAERLARSVKVLPQKAFDHGEIIVDGLSIRIVRDTRFGVDGYQLWLPVDRWSDGVTRMKEQCGLTFAGRQAIDILRIEAGIPIYGMDYDGSNLPLESNLDHALNFNKGCYTGQEVIARVAYLGSVSKKLMGLLVQGDTIPKRGEEVVVENQPAGRITSATISLKLGQPVALAYMLKKFLMPGTEVELKLSEARATVHRLPLVSRDV
ncbi:MAG: aminomethyl transferase family protein [Acidobacteria bacterium]|nr:aminomethyl transferase family protein [Acidobacteriota bacterium]